METYEKPSDDRTIVGFVQHPDSIEFQLANGDTLKVPMEPRPEISCTCEQKTSTVRGFKFVEGGIAIDNTDDSTMVIKYEDMTTAYDKEQKMIEDAKKSGELLILGVSHYMLDKKLVFTLSNGVELTVTDDEIIKFYTQIKEQENKPKGGIDASALGTLIGAFAGSNLKYAIPTEEISETVNEE